MLQRSLEHLISIWHTQIKQQSFHSLNAVISLRKFIELDRPHAPVQVTQLNSTHLVSLTS